MFRMRLIAAIVTTIAICLTSIPATAAPIANQSFNNVWTQTDGPVKDQVVNRTWMWGPAADSGLLWENYAQSPGGRRQVQYFDKARMEINDPNADPTSEWYVTNGLLAKEMITGQLQIGDNSFVPESPAQVNVAGDTNDPNGPTYASFSNVMTYGAIPNGWDVTQTIDRAGSVGTDKSLASYDVTATDVGAPTKHTVASVFWDFMNSSGIIATESGTAQGRLFANPFYATGYPLTEPYWTYVLVGGIQQLVFVQVFERRVLTYTPNNPEGWKVEAGNVGLEYYNWRYGQLRFTPVLVQSSPPSSDAYKSLGLWQFPQGFAGESSHISLDPSGQLWAVGTNNALEGEIVQFQPSGSILGDWVSAANQSSFVGLDAHHSSTQLVVNEARSNTIETLVILPDGSLGFASSWSQGSFGGVDLATDSHQNIYVNDLYSLEKYSSSGVKESTISWPGGLNLIQGIYVDRSDRVYLVGDFDGSGQITGGMVEMDSAGNVLSAWTTPVVYNMIAVDGLGNWYMAQYNGSVVVKYDPSGAFVTTIGEGQIQRIVSLDVSAGGTVYASSDSGIYVFVPGS